MTDRQVVYCRDSLDKEMTYSQVEHDRMVPAPVRLLLPLNL